jgi:uncharacterized protein (DUF302 family)
MTNDYGRQVVIDLPFDAASEEIGRVMREEGLQVLATIDVRDELQRTASHAFRRYVLLEAWAPKPALNALRHHLDAGVVLPITFAVYELADGETAVVVREPFGAELDDPGWRSVEPDLASMAYLESVRVARVLDRLCHRTPPQGAVLPAA